MGDPRHAARHGCEAPHSRAGLRRRYLLRLAPAGWYKNPVRKSFTAVLERNATFDRDFETEPYEVGWASEARWFVRVLAAEGADISLACMAQVSPDGLGWCDEGSPPLLITAPGLYSFALRDFGGWLRLRCDVRGLQPSVKVLISLALKE